MARNKSKRINTYTLESATGYLLEVYMPKRIAYLSGVYGFLKQELSTNSQERAAIHGFSIYTVDGAFRGGSKTYDESTLVIRMFFDAGVLKMPEERGLDSEASELDGLQAKASDIFRELMGIADGNEEEIWAMRTPTHVYKAILKEKFK